MYTAVAAAAAAARAQCVVVQVVIVFVVLPKNVCVNCFIDPKTLLMNENKC